MVDRPAAPAIVVEGASKTFRIPHEQLLTLKERALHPLRKRTYETLDALKDVSFTVETGEFFGIVGRNGSGKSTLLKCLAGIYRLGAGEMYVDGRVSTFIELGAGFNPDLAARDNVVMNGIMLGLTPREARHRFEEVIEFAELEDFVDLKLKNYSSGMTVRLAFSVAIQADPDILLIDEVLAVGDASFQQKCFEVFHRMREDGKTVLFVTHDMGAVARFCHRALLLERGQVVSIGAPEDVGNDYIALNFADEQQVRGDGARVGDGTAVIEDVWTEDDEGARQATIVQGRACTVRMRVRFEQPVTDPSFHLAFVNEHRQNQFIVSTLGEIERTGSFAPGDSVVFSGSFSCAFAPGRYGLSALVAHRGSGDRFMDLWEQAASIVVAGVGTSGGLVDLPHEVHLDRVGARLEKSGT